MRLRALGARIHALSHIHRNFRRSTAFRLLGLALVVGLMAALSMAAERPARP